MSNKYIGTVDFVLGDKTLKLHYDYEAISTIITKFGKEILNTLYEASPDEVAFILAAGLKKDNVTIADIMAVSPPIFASCRLIDTALGFSYFGPDGPPKPVADSKKKLEPKTK